MRKLAAIPGPFASVYLPATSAWRTLRIALTDQHVDPATLSAIDAAMDEAISGSGPSVVGRVLVATADRILVDEPPSWSPPSTIARVSDLPYLLPLMPSYATHEPHPAPVPSVVAVGQGGSAAQPRLSKVVTDASRTVFDQFLFEWSRTGGLAVEGLELCAEKLREHNADALVISVDVLDDALVWVGGAQRDQVAAAEASLRGQGKSVNRQRADEALPMAALTIGAEVMVTAERLPLMDGVGVLLRHP